MPPEPGAQGRSGSPFRVGLIGAGMITHHHLIGWSKIADAKVVAVCDPDIDRAKRRAEEFGIEAVHVSMEALLADESIDAVDIATPRETHVEMVRHAIARKLAVLCQKPLAPTFREASDLVDEAENTIRLMVHENWRFRPFYRRIRKILDAGAVGKPRHFRLSHFSGGLLPDAEGRFPALERQPFMRTEKRLLIAETLIHHLDVARWLLGPLNVRAACARRAVDVVAGETLASIFMETPEGFPALVEGNMAVDGTPARARDRMQIVCEHGVIDLKDDVLTLTGPESLTESFDFDQSYQASFDSAVAHFVECLATGNEFETDARENLATLKLVEDAYALAGRQAVEPV